MQTPNRPAFSRGIEVQLKRIATILESRPLALVETSRITMCELRSLENGTKVWRISSESYRNHGRCFPSRAERFRIFSPVSRGPSCGLGAWPDESNWNLTPGRDSRPLRNLQECLAPQRSLLQSHYCRQSSRRDRRRSDLQARRCSR